MQFFKGLDRLRIIHFKGEEIIIDGFGIFPEKGFKGIYAFQIQIHIYHFVILVTLDHHVFLVLEGLPEEHDKRRKKMIGYLPDRGVHYFVDGSTVKNLQGSRKEVLITAYLPVKGIDVFKNPDFLEERIILHNFRVGKKFLFLLGRFDFIH
jgi:hypothetical protein